MEIKPTERHHFTPTKIDRIFKLQNLKQEKTNSKRSERISRTRKSLNSERIRSKSCLN